MPNWGRIGAGVASGGLSEFGMQKPFGLEQLSLQRGANSPYRDVDPQGNLAGEAGMASGLADAATANQFGARMRQSELADMLQGRARGEGLYSDEMLRQGLQQQLSGMSSMAAGAAPQNAAMAARNAMTQGGRAMSGLAGQQALAGIREQAAAQQQLGGVLGGMRGQDLQAALGSRGQALQGYGDLERARTGRYGAEMGAPAPGEFLLGAGQGIAGMAAMSDERAKTAVKPADEEAEKLLKGLQAFTYRYKDERHGKGDQLGILAQDLEKVAPHAVIDTPEGKMVHGAKLAGTLAAGLAALSKRVSGMEGGE